MGGSFDSAWLKWAWAVVDAQALQEDVHAFAADTNTQATANVKQYYDPKRHAVVLAVATLAHPFPDRWGVRLGDVIQNYRSCLDHLAWALVKRGRTPALAEAQEAWVYFPITTERGAFNASLKGRRPKLPGVRRADVAIVRRYQPYRHGKRNRERHVLYVLDHLSRLDKHRTIQPVVGTPDSAHYSLKAAYDCDVIRIRRSSRREPVQEGTEIGVFYVRKTGPNPKIEVDGDLPLYPAVNATLRLETWLDRTMRTTFQILNQFAPPHSAVRDVLAYGGVIAEDDPWESPAASQNPLP